MPDLFAPKDACAVVFVGKDALDHFADFAAYWARTLDETFWDKLLLVRVSPEPLDFPKFEDNRTRALVERHLVDFPDCAAVKAEEPKKTNVAIGERMLGMVSPSVSLSLHLICGGFGQPDVHALQSLQIAQDIIRRVGASSVFTYFYYLLHTSRSARLNQRRFMEALEEARKKDFRYKLCLLSRRDNLDTPAPLAEIWRAVAIEIMLNADRQRQFMQNMNGALYSLGYTGLNADGNDLLQLCRKVAVELLTEQHDAPMSPAEFWRLLLDTPQPPAFDEVDVESSLREWLERLSDAHLPRADARQTANLLSLQNIRNKDQLGRLVEAWTEFYRLNIRGGGYEDWAAQMKKDAHDRLLYRLNATQCEDALLETIIRSLDRICQTVPPRGANYVPGSKHLFQKMEDFLAIEAEKADALVRKAIRGNIARKRAGALKQALTELKAELKLVQRNDRFVAEADRRVINSREYDRLQRKYVNYFEMLKNNAVLEAPRHFAEGWDTEFFPIWDAQGNVVTGNLEKMISQTAKWLRETMGIHGRTFIDAIRLECATPAAMTDFLEKHLNNSFNRRFFRCVEDSAAAIDRESRIMVDAELLLEEWVMNFGGTALSVDSDNLERLDCYPLQPGHNLEWLLNNNINAGEYFGDQEDDDEESGEGGYVTDWTRAERSSAAGETQSVPTRVATAEDPNPYHVRIMERKDPQSHQSRYYLYWDWPPNESGLNVSLNEKNAMHITEYEFARNGGMDVTTLAIPGENKIHISYMSHRPMVSGLSINGKQTRVGYSIRQTAKNDGTSVLSIAPFNGKIMLTETQVNGRVCRYPIAPGQPGRDGRIEYTGLRLSGSKKVESSPEDRFPMIQLVSE